MSADPYLRLGLKYQAEENKVMEGFIAGKIIASKNENWIVGDLFGGSFPFTTI